MQIHICDTRDLAVHCCCGGFIWPETVKAYCGKEFSFKPPVAEAINPSGEGVCAECIEEHKRDSQGRSDHLFVIRE